ncbi:NADH-quinone oxidoreductase subunit N [Thermodesulfovibrio sp.]|uniref:NADH-quinone oxidoreductase subunit N n=1 Tax=Thermodesulfovibrio sp. TaxID=2067987 RepID=UPI00309CB2D2
MNQYIALIPEMALLTLGIVVFLYGLIRKDIKTIFLFGILSIAVSTSLALMYSSEFSNSLIRIDIYTILLRLLILFTGILVLMLSYDELSRNSSMANEYVFLIILALFGMNLMIAANDLLILYLSLEAFSLPLYILAGFYIRNKQSVEAGLKYFILGTVASILLIGSIVFFYANTGSTSYESFAALKWDKLSSILILVFLLFTFTFKLSLVPFHAWAPDVYQGAPTPVTAFFSTAPKVAAFAVLIKVFLVSQLEIKPQTLIIILSALSMIVGNLLALRQTNLKRLFAYSSIAHAGYMSMALLLVDNTLILSLIPYLIAYVFMNIGAFAVILSISGGENILNYRGLNKVNSLIAISMAIILISLTGIPPTAGFIVKFNLFKNVFMAGYQGLVFLGLLMSVLSAYYYLRIVFYIYKDVPSRVSINKNSLISGVALASAVFLILSGVIPSLLMIN